MNFARQISSFNGLNAALRDRKNQLNVAGEMLDDLAGLPDRYVGKITADPPIKTLGAKSLDALLGALALKLLIVDDADQYRKIRHRLTPKGNGNTSPSVMGSSPEIEEAATLRVRQILHDRGRRGALARLRNQSPEERSACSRAAANARWTRWREKRRGGG